MGIIVIPLPPVIRDLLDRVDYICNREDNSFELLLELLLMEEVIAQYNDSRDKLIALINEHFIFKSDLTESESYLFEDWLEEYESIIFDTIDSLIEEYPILKTITNGTIRVLVILEDSFIITMEEPYGYI